MNHYLVSINTGFEELSHLEIPSKDMAEIIKLIRELDDFIWSYLELLDKEKE